VIVLSGVSKSYYARDKVLDRISLRLGKGEFLYLIGGSGAGKSTLLRMLATEESPSEGRISLFGYELDKVSSSTLRSVRAAIGYVPQDVRLIPDLSVYDNILLGAAFAGHRAKGNGLRAQIGELTHRLGIAHRRDHLCGKLSGGEAQRVAVARALVRSPEIVLADEPTGAQDRDHTWKLIELLSQANAKGATVIVATHDREIVRRVRKPCAALSGGRIAVEPGARPGPEAARFGTA